jgi:hypothetical protein
MISVFLFFLSLFAAMSAQVFFIEGYYKNRKISPLFISSVTLAASFVVLFLCRLIRKTFFEQDWSNLKEGDLIYLDGPPIIFSYVTSSGLGLLFSGLLVIWFYLYSYYTIKLDKNVREIKDINIGLPKEILNILNKFRYK